MSKKISKKEGPSAQRLNDYPDGQYWLSLHADISFKNQIEEMTEPSPSPLELPIQGLLMPCQLARRFFEGSKA